MQRRDKELQRKLMCTMNPEVAQHSVNTTVVLQSARRVTTRKTVDSALSLARQVTTAVRCKVTEKAGG